jgi:hypothetical protein
MTDQNQIVEKTQTDTKQNDKELNFRALEARFEKKLSEEREARLEAERRLQEKAAQQVDDDDSEPYVDHKKLTKKFSAFEKNIEEKIDKRAEEKARGMLHKERQEGWLRDNPDFYDVMQLAEKFANKAPKLAESILKMPDTFERQQLVYNNIKAMGLDGPDKKDSSVQQKIDANRKSPYYQPSGVGTAPYSSQSDFSANGQKQAYDKLQELKRNLRI